MIQEERGKGKIVKQMSKTSTKVQFKSVSRGNKKSERSSTHISHLPAVVTKDKKKELPSEVIKFRFGQDPYSLSTKNIITNFSHTDSTEKRHNKKHTESS